MSDFHVPPNSTDDISELSNKAGKPNRNAGPHRVLRVALLVYQQVLATSLTLPIEMLRAGEAFGRRHDKSKPKMEVQLVSDNLNPIKSQAGFSLTPDTMISDETSTSDKTSPQTETPDIVIIPSIWRNPRPLLRKHHKLVHWLHFLRSKGTTLVGVGTGVCFIAESGLLDGHPATTHWHYFEQFKRDYPNAQLKPDYFITQSEGIYCAASLNALADIVVHLIEVNYGDEAANNVQRNFSHEIRKPYEQQRFLEGGVDRLPDELIAQIQFWMKNNLSSTTNLADIAQQFGISRRSLTRRFKTATGSRATVYWRQLRVETAKELLGASNLSIQDIALSVGYQDQGHLTRLFKQTLNMTPTDYRSTVRKKLFSN